MARTANSGAVSRWRTPDIRFDAPNVVVGRRPRARDRSTRLNGWAFAALLVRRARPATGCFGFGFARDFEVILERVNEPLRKDQFCPFSSR